LKKGENKGASISDGQKKETCEKGQGGAAKGGYRKKDSIYFEGTGDLGSASASMVGPEFKKERDLGTSKILRQ